MDIIELLVNKGVYVNSCVNNPFTQPFKSSVKLARDYEFNTIEEYLLSKGSIDVQNKKFIIDPTKMSPIFVETLDIKNKLEEILGEQNANIVVKVGVFKKIKPFRRLILR